jgi:hypothetical protein
VSQMALGAGRASGMGGDVQAPKGGIGGAGLDSAG